MEAGADAGVEVGVDSGISDCYNVSHSNLNPSLATYPGCLQTLQEARMKFTDIGQRVACFNEPLELVIF